MITANVLRRVFFFKAADYGTAFSIHVDGREYLITAKHLLTAESEPLKASVMHDNKWCDLNAELVGRSKKGVDIAVLAMKTPLAPDLPMVPSAEGAIVGQDMYFLGFPFKLWTNAGPAMGGWPFPFVKRATWASTTDIGDGVERFYLDALSNQGFSGGPVVFRKGTSTEFSVCAVASGFRTEREAVMDDKGEPTGDTVEYNSGFLVADSIDYALRIIRENPIGLKVG